MLRSYFTALFLFGFTGISCIESKSIQVAAVSTNSDSRLVTLENDVLVLINKYRQSKGLSTFSLNAIVGEEARTHSANMANGKVPFSHEGFNTRSKAITTRIPGIKSIAENVAYGQKSAREVVTDWINSPGHKHNIDGNYSQTGIGIVADKRGVLYYTQMFVR